MKVWTEITSEIPKSAKWVAIAFLFIFALAIYLSSTLFTSYPQDNIIEQSVEEILKEETGLDVDLSPPHSLDAGK